MAFMQPPIFHAPGCLSCLLLLAGTAWADQFQGVAKNFGKEQCVILDHFPADSGAKYRENDTKKEQELCGISFDDKGIGMCPKTWSTSPGTIVYDIRKSKYNGKPDTFEAEYCPKQRVLKGKVDGVEKLASFNVHVSEERVERQPGFGATVAPTL